LAEYKRPTTEAEFEQNFAQKKPLMNPTEAYYESSRCLFCYDAPCVQVCPTHIDIPLFIKQIQTGNISGSAKTIFESNWLGNACGKVCPTDVLCEGACVYDNQHVPVIQIGRLQNFATQTMIDEGSNLFKPGEGRNGKIAIIGGGPAGIACACELRMLGYQAVIFEAKDLPSGLTVHGVAPYKITNEEVLAEVDFLQQQLGFEIRYGQEISDQEDLQAIEQEFDAVFLGVGLGATRQLVLPGEDKKNVVGAVEFIEDLRMQHHRIEVPDRVVVLGGGNTAMDAASESARMGATEVTLAYRRSRSEMGGYDFEYELAKSVGAIGLFNVTPLEILGNERVTGIRMIRTSTANGKVVTIPDSEFELSCDMVIKATGQAKQGSFLAMIEGLELDQKKRIVVSSNNYQTTKPKYFAGGDAVNGGAEVVNAAYEGKMAAQGIHRWLESKRE